MSRGDSIGKLALVGAGAATSAVITRQISNSISFLSPTVTGVALAVGAYFLYDKDDSRGGRDINFFLMGLLGGALGSGISQISGMPIDKMLAAGNNRPPLPGASRNVQIIVE